MGGGGGVTTTETKTWSSFYPYSTPLPFCPLAGRQLSRTSFLSFIPYPGLFSLPSFSISYELLSITIVNKTENIHFGKFLLFYFVILSFSVFLCVAGRSYWREKGGTGRGKEPNHSLQNIRLQYVQFQNVLTSKYFKTSGFKNVQYYITNYEEIQSKRIAKVFW